MRVPIDAPKFRPLTPNEQKVYSLLRMGYKPKEVARQVHMPVGDEFFCNAHDVTCDTVNHLITSIREKGWDIPGKEDENKEDEDVQKYTDKQKEKALQLFEEGMTPKDISIKMKLPYKSVWKWCDTYKKQKQFEQNIEDASKVVLADAAEVTEDIKEEPASVAADTDSGVENLDSISNYIITENLVPVKIPDEMPTVVMDALLEKREAIQQAIAEEEHYIKSLYDNLRVLDEYIAGGVVGE